MAYLRSLFLIAVCAAVLLSAISREKKTSLRVKSFLLHAALVCFLSSLILTLFASPESPDGGGFAGFKYWIAFFGAVGRLSPFAFNAFDASSASLVPLCDAAVLLLLYSVMRCRCAEAVPAQKAPERNTRILQPVRKPLTRTQISSDVYAQLQSLASLRAQGMISDAEFYRRKRELLER